MESSGLIASKKSCLTARDEDNHSKEESLAASAEIYSDFEIIYKRDSKNKLDLLYIL